MLHAACIVLEQGHPYLQLQLQFAVSLRPRLLALVDEVELDRPIEEATAEPGDGLRQGTTSPLVQAWGKVQ